MSDDGSGDLCDSPTDAGCGGGMCEGAYLGGCPAGTKANINKVVGSSCMDRWGICGFDKSRWEYVCGHTNDGCCGSKSKNMYKEYACDPICPVPSAPALMSPEDGSFLAISKYSKFNTVNLAWYSSDFGNGSAECISQYKVYVDTTNPPTTQVATLDSSINSYSFRGGSPGTYYWSVAASNSDTDSKNNEIRSFTIVSNEIMGKVFYDVNNTCGGTPKSGVQITYPNPNPSRGDPYLLTSTTGVDGVYSAYVEALRPGSTPITINLTMPPGFSCSTGPGCSNCGPRSITAPSVNNDFYLSDLRDPWWQAMGSGIYSGGAI
ncbi:MAG: hypothetical protein WCI88_14950, partial [Chloroflexota bacterium]